MKLKKGFTLSEVLLAICIIAILAALMGTAFNHSKPDKTKFLYLKAYDALSEAVVTLINNPELYKEVYTKSDGKTYNIENYPMLDIGAPNDTEYSSFTGNGKFASLLGEYLRSDSKNWNGSVYNFETMPGNLKWSISPQGEGSLSDENPSTLTYNNKVDLEIGGKSFGFCVQADGHIDILDNEGQTYIDNRKNLRSKNDVQLNAVTTTTCTSPVYVVEETENENVFNVSIQN